MVRLVPARATWTLAAISISLAGTLLAPVAALAQDPAPTPAGATEAASTAPPDALTVVATYPAVVADPGGEAIFELIVTAPGAERVDLSVEGVPDGFDASFHGGDATVSSVSTGSEEPPDLELRISVPDEAAPGSTPLTVVATGESGSVQVPIDVIVSDTSGGAVSLTTDFPFLRGDSESSFSFDLQLANDTAREITFALEGSGPEGWDVNVRPSGEEQAATLAVAADDDERVNVTVDPARLAAAGTYPVVVRATGDGYTAETELIVEITGTYALTLDAPDGRLNATATAGSATTFNVVVLNDGTAPLENVDLSGTPPRGWEVVFEPESIELILPGESAQASARITPAGSAVAGDYVVTLRANSEQADDSIEVRTTVETSTIWGFLGIGIIVVVLVGLFLVFRTYGRR